MSGEHYQAYDHQTWNGVRAKLAHHRGLSEGVVFDAINEALAEIFPRPEEALDWLGRFEEKDTWDLVRELSRVNAARIEANLPEDRPSIAIWENAEGRFNHLAAMLTESGVNVIRPFLGRSERVEVPGIVYAGLVTPRYLAKVPIVIACTNALPEPPPGVARVHFPHGLVFHEKDPVGAKMYWWQQFSNYDYFLLPDPMAAECDPRISQKLQAALSQVRAKPHWLFGTLEWRTHLRDHVTFSSIGYLKLDELINKSRSSTPNRSILYAPTPISQGPGSSSLEHFGKDIVASLLEAFPDMVIQFRPYIGDRNSSVVTSILETFSKNPRFHYDTSGSNTDSLCNAAILVTDTSLMRFTFAFGTLRPVICFATQSLADRDSNNTAQNRAIGFEVSNVHEVVDSARKALRDLDHWRDSISKFRAEVLGHPGAATTMAVRAIHQILLGKPLPSACAVDLPPRRNPSLKEAMVILDECASTRYRFEYFLPSVVAIGNLFSDNTQIQEKVLSICNSLGFRFQPRWTIASRN